MSLVILWHSACKPIAAEGRFLVLLSAIERIINVGIEVATTMFDWVTGLFSMLGAVTYALLAPRVFKPKIEHHSR
jgi:hypothetical protein